LPSSQPHRSRRTSWRGIIWAGQYVQLGIEAVIPLNNRSGNHVGWIAQLHFFLDDLFPHTIGRPVFRN
jgi:hypothetical protein